MAPLIGGQIMIKPDNNSIQKLKSMLNSPEGENLKRKFAGVDKAELMRQLKNMNIDNLSESDIQRILSQVDSDQLISMLKNFNADNFKKR